MAEERVQRKLTTILAADVEGYSRLMSADEETTLKTLKTYREIIDGLIARHDGRIFGTAGDSVVAEFGSAVEAVRCAIEIQEELKVRNAELVEDLRMMFRIGINVGDVMVEGDNLFGDGVNVAARLEGVAEAGGICISRSAFDQVRNKLSIGFEDIGPQQVKNIAEPVSTYRLVPGRVSVSAGATAGAGPSGAKRWARPAIAAFVLVIIAAGGLAVWWPWVPIVEPASVERMAFALPDKPSIAVLPFNNMSDDPSQEYFVDGMTEDLITDLSKISALFVIARNSVFTYKGRPVKVQQVAEELGVRYVLEGSVRRIGDQVRINAQLIDAETGGHLWADCYDGSMANVFELQDQVTRTIVAALEVNLTAKEQDIWTRKRNENPQAYDAFLQSWEYYQRFSADDFVKAIPLFEKAVQLDPDYGRAYAALASLYWKSFRQGESRTLKVSPNATSAGIFSLGQSRIRANKYLDLAMKTPSPRAHQVASAIHWDSRLFDDAIAEAEQAVTLDPNDPDGHVALAWAMFFNGRPQEALAAIDRAMRLDPHNPGGGYLYVLGLARLGLDQHRDALADLQLAHQRSPDYLDVNLALAAAYAHFGRLEEARAALDPFKETLRIFKFDGVMGRWPFRREPDLRRFGEMLIKAGVGSDKELNLYINFLSVSGTLQ